MILSDTQIVAERKKKRIIISPFNKKFLGSNSYDVHLGRILALYKNPVLDAKKHNKVVYIKIPKSGYVLAPGTLYLAVTQEYTESLDHVPFLEGKSSTGRLGLSIHATAGKGDVGFKGNWTMEITVTQPVKVYVGMPIGQLIYFVVEGKVKNRYDKKEGAKYSHQPDKPIESMMWKNKF